VSWDEFRPTLPARPDLSLSARIMAATATRTSPVIRFMPATGVSTPLPVAGPDLVAGADDRASASATTHGAS
jgi:hypothetical protein